MRRSISSFVLILSLAACSGAPTTDESASVKPGINNDFLDPQLDVGKYEQRFEVESREIFSQRARIASLVPIDAGGAVADVGAGTGLFTWMFAQKTGPNGKVYAVDIAPKFVDHLRQTAEAKRMGQVEAVLCTERSAELPENSVDAIFVCDTYHHFEYPQATLASLLQALRPGGTLVVVDFIREPGVSRPWILEHVRAGMAEVKAEIEAAGFRFLDQPATPFLRENYCLRFTRP
jgi:ubiquinone/menaquinone biosynthesis C-methylase UbiE